ncbi:hypothetical protein AXF42_Ash017558 [Apostasia shenzhenica]|uniref:Uncharacterized protein n=1 Tax=Apostasia shenzhenica TaxID=1088818 RepID=A0A2I0A3B1_9ASPA|nr:hypothetical protein AXF42_Ash017558 [Apostasia shenzhenica]
MVRSWHSDNDNRTWEMSSPIVLGDCPEHRGRHLEQAGIGRIRYHEAAIA